MKSIGFRVRRHTIEIFKCDGLKGMVLMVFGNFITTAQRGIFDVRHYITAGYGLMAFVLVLISQTNLQARMIDPKANFSQKKMATPENSAIPRNFKLTLLEKISQKTHRDQQF